ncbi:hypothetical protein HMPREF3189_01651, partial [Clostridiales bacterium KA00134]
NRMAVLHREDSIIGIKKEQAEKQQGFMTVGRQIAKLTVELNKKEKVIETLGKQFTINMLKMAQMEKEIAQLKGGK